MKFRVCDLKHKDIERIRNARAVWGHEKYGDRDKDREKDRDKDRREGDRDKDRQKRSRH